MAKDLKIPGSPLASKILNTALSTKDTCKSPDSAKTQTKQIGLFKAIFLVTRSFIGVGILAQPHLNHDFGMISLIISYPIVAGMIIYL